MVSPAQRAKARGAATVETAVMLVVLVPTLMYSFFLDDLLRYRLDVQEAVVSTPWDYVPVDYSGTPQLEAVARAARLMWCDHISTYDSYDKQYDCRDEHHHLSEGAHVCWLTKVSPEPGSTAPPPGSPQADQVRCSIRKNVGAPTDGTAVQFHQAYTQGGMVACRGRVGVLNYFLPAEFFPQFAKAKVTEAQKFEMGTAIHTNATQNIFSSRKAFFLEQEKFSIVTDPWAINESPDYERNQTGGKLLDRVKTVYEATEQMGNAQSLSTTFLQTLNLYLEVDYDDLATPNVAVKHADDAPPPTVPVVQAGATASFYATPWKDWWNGNKAEEVWNARSNTYMGGAGY